ncbi:MAG: sigma-70 family RNA polymerase sigma factor [Pirellulales bacterium]|nr:sigma-70 family RNA polymerase sigma factor [Pirellulales bacterium]
MPDVGGRSEFDATRWTLVLSAAGGTHTPSSAAAMAELCAIYWYPLYAFIRRRGHDAHEAEDLVQEFFARLLVKDFLAGVSPEKGRFRSFLLAAFKHFLANEYDRAGAQKRGGARTVIALDALGADSRWRLEPADTLTPEKLFERRWALAVLEQVLARLQAEMTAAGKGPLYEALKEFLGGEGRDTYAEVGTKLGMSSGAVKVAVHRLRRRWRQVLREEIAQTVADPAEIDAEIRYLLSCL